jgi:ATP-dependent exoDNAse (exonuclease V) beta subunit
LLFEEDAGWVLVDYKTDAIPAEEQAPLAGIREKYSAQVNAYRSALEQVGIAVKSAYLLLARTGEAVEADLHNSRAAPSPAE